MGGHTLHRITWPSFHMLGSGREHAWSHVQTHPGEVY